MLAHYYDLVTNQAGIIFRLIQVLRPPCPSIDFDAMVIIARLPLAFPTGNCG